MLSPPAATRAVELKKFQEQTVTAILNQVTELQEAGALQIPENYAVGNQLKLAWLRLLETETRDKRPVLEACTRESICNALLEMVIQGMSVAKKQVDFIAYGNRLTLQREYHGTIALALRLGGVKQVPTGAVVYEKDDFEFAINPNTGRRQIIKHNQKLANIDPDKIVAAYAVIPLTNGETHVEIMTMQQIRQSWMQGATKGQSPAHKNFPDQMAIKTVISRGCKLFISSSSDAGLVSDTDEMPIEQQPASLQPPKKQNRQISMKAEEAEIVPEENQAVVPRLRSEMEKEANAGPDPTAEEIPDWMKTQ